MHMVVDTNRLQSPELRTFLEASDANRAVLTDYAAMEALQGDAVKSICNIMRILGDHPNQVIVLNNTQPICQLSGEADGLQSRLIDNGQTSGFPDYIRKLKEAEQGHQLLREEIQRMAVDAKQQLQRMLGDAPGLAQNFDNLAVNFNKEERQKIRDGEPYNAKMVDNLMRGVMQVSIELFRTLSLKVPDYKELPNTFIFRNALCCYLLALEWASIGGVKDAQNHKIRNDIVDTHFATYGTYFDGLMTGDAKALRVYKRAKEILAYAFG